MQVYPSSSFNPWSRLSRARDRFPRFAVGGAAALSFALVPELFALRQGQFHFDASAFEIQARRNEGHTLLLRFANQLAQLSTMDQQLSCAHRLVVENVPVLILSAMSVEQPEFSALDEPV